MTKRSEENAAQLSEASLTDEWLTEWENRVGLDLRVGNVFKFEFPAACSVGCIQGRVILRFISEAKRN